jgi:amino acid adenylation domain-containing protein
MADHFETLLKGIIANPDKSVSELPLLTRAEQRQLTRWNDTSVDYPSQLTFHELFEAQAERTPHSIAVVHEGEQLTYRELNRRANHFAHYLREQGVSAETRIGVLMERSNQMVVALLGVLKAGGAYVPLDPEYPHERLAFMMQDVGIAVLLTQSQVAEAGLSQLAGEQTRVVEIDREWKVIGERSGENPAPVAAPDNLAHIIYTSGSTGTPKGVMISHRSLINLLYSIRRFPGLAADDRLLAIATLSFDIAGLEFWLPLTVGASLIVSSRAAAMDARLLSAQLIHGGVTVLQATPATWQMLVGTGWPGSKSLRIWSGGEALGQGLAQELVGRSKEVWNLYGPTETTIYSSLTLIGTRGGATDQVSIGSPIANTQVYVLDGHLQPVPVGVTGELYIGGDGLARGYWLRPEQTAERFVPNPFAEGPGQRMYRTGDVVRYRSDGKMDYLGRGDAQVKMRGFRIELGEIESVLATHAAIKECVVTVVGEAGDKRLVAYVVNNDAEEEVDSGRLRTYLKERLPEYMVPSAFVMLTELPLTPNGKVDRKALPEPGQSAGEVWLGYVAPSTPMEEVLCGMWEQVLKLDQVGVHDNFFELGGHSLLATQVISQVREAFGVELPLRRLFETPTVATLAAVVEVSQLEQADSEKLTELLEELEELSEDGAELIAGQEKMTGMEAMNE